MDVSEIEKTVPEVTAGRGSPMLKGNVDRGIAGIEPKPEERMARTDVGGGSRRTEAKVRTAKTARAAAGDKPIKVPELTHLGGEIDIFA